MKNWSDPNTQEGTIILDRTIDYIPEKDMIKVHELEGQKVIDWIKDVKYSGDKVIVYYERRKVVIKG